MATDRNEPSMEAILSSIKKIIADEDRSRAISSRRSPRETLQDESEDEDVLELTEAAATENTEELLDDSKAQSLRQSFSVLQTLSEPGVAPQIVRSGETSLEGLTRELMKPMLAAAADSVRKRLGSAQKAGW